MPSTDIYQEAGTRNRVLPLADGTLIPYVQPWYGSASNTGTYGYAGGVSGTVVVPTGAVVIGMAASAPSSGGGTVTINGGNAIPIPANKAWNSSLNGSASVLVAPVIVFAGTDSYTVEWVV